MPSVDQATQIFSILSDLVVAHCLSKHNARFPLNDDLRVTIAKASSHYDTFLSGMKKYAKLDDGLMERFAMVPWLSSQAIDVAYCEGYFSLALNESVLGSYERGDLQQVASRVSSALWPRLVHALTVARFDCPGETPSPSYQALADVLRELNIVLEAEPGFAAHKARAVMTSWWSQRAKLSSYMPSNAQESFLAWTATEEL